MNVDVRSLTKVKCEIYRTGPLRTPNQFGRYMPADAHRFVARAASSMLPKKATKNSKIDVRSLTKVECD